MTRKQLYNILNKTGLPYRLRAFKEEQDTPYIIIVPIQSDDDFADDNIFNKYTNYQVELYTDEKDYTLQEKIEKIFFENNVIYTSSETFIEEENLYEVLYLITLEGV